MYIHFAKDKGFWGRGFLYTLGISYVSGGGEPSLHPMLTNVGTDRHLAIMQGLSPSSGIDNFQRAVESVSWWGGNRILRAQGLLSPHYSSVGDLC